MLLFKHYDEDDRCEEAWFDSSMFVYTKMIEDENENKGDLYVTFKNGSTYKYKDVRFEDYVVLIAGGTEQSQGKTLNKIIKPNYEFEKCDNAGLNELAERMDALMKSETEKEDLYFRTYFISGHRNLTEDEFERYYQNPITEAVDSDPDSRFVVGACVGCDIMAQNYLIDILGIDPSRITVYYVHMDVSHFNPKVVNRIEFKDHIEKDTAMTNASFQDIAFVRDPNKISGTASNILRRKCFSI